MQDLLIRRGAVSDAAALAELAARTFTDAFASDNRPEDLRAHIASAYGVSQQSAELADPKTITLLAARGGALIGYAQVRSHGVPACVTQARPVELQRFYLDRSAHGTGVAKELMAAVHEAAGELGGRNLWLGVWERNARAIAFYSKMGFTKVGSHSFMVGSDRQTDDVMVAAVSQDSAMPTQKTDGAR